MSTKRERRWVTALWVLAWIVPSAFAYAAALGLGLHRHGRPWAISLAATVLIFLPPIMVATVAKNRWRASAIAGTCWSLVGLLLLPVYFPGERRDAVSTGLALVLGGTGVAERVADSLPAEIEMSEPELAEAVVVPPTIVPPTQPLDDRAITLPYEGGGRNLAIPVVFGHGDREVEVLMLLDTGATYTTLTEEVFEQLGITPDADDPVLTMHTANGTREAAVRAVDRVWLGDLQLDTVAVTSCDVCASNKTVGLLGLNVAGGFNVSIDADRSEVTFTRRANHDRKLDVKPWVSLDARFARYPGGRVEVTIDFVNDSAYDLLSVDAKVGCGPQSWIVSLGSVEQGEDLQERRKLPRHEACESYEISLHDVKI